MKAPLSIMALALLCACASVTSDLPERDKTITGSKLFVSNTAMKKQSNTLLLSFDGKTAHVERTEGKTIPEAEENVIYIETENVRVAKNGVITARNPSHKVWFVPFWVGAPCVDLTTTCFKYNCCARGDQSSFSRYCTILNSGNRITCQNADPMDDRNCMTISGTINCHTGNFYEFYGGGIIIDAEHVIVKDPDYYKPNPNGSLSFMVMDNDDIIKAEDYKQYKAEMNKKDKRSKRE